MIGLACIVDMVDAVATTCVIRPVERLVSAFAEMFRSVGNREYGGQPSRGMSGATATVWLDSQCSENGPRSSKTIPFVEMLSSRADDHRRPMGESDGGLPSYESLPSVAPPGYDTLRFDKDIKNFTGHT